MHRDEADIRESPFESRHEKATTTLEVELLKRHRTLHCEFPFLQIHGFNLRGVMKCGVAWLTSRDMSDTVPPIVQVVGFCGFDWIQCEFGELSFPGRRLIRGGTGER